MTCSQGWKTVVFAKQSSQTSNPSYVVGDVLDVVSENMQISETLFGGEQVIRGRRDRIAQTIALANVSVGGTLSMLMNYKHLNFWLSAATGTAATPFIPTEALLPYAIGVQRATTAGALRSYNNCLVNTLTLAGAEGGPITMDVSLLGRNYKDLAPTALATPAISSTDYSTGGWAPFMFSNLVVTIGGSAIGIQGFSLELNNFLSPAVLNNLQTQEICTEDLSVTLSLTGRAFDMRSQLYDTTNTATGLGKPGNEVEVVMTFTHAGGNTLTITLPKWSFVRSESGTSGRGTMTTTFSGECYANATATPTNVITFATA